MVVALVLVAIYLGHQAAKKRCEAMAALAADLGWSFSPEKDTRHDDEYAHFEIFRRGHLRAAFNTLRGHLEIDGRSFSAKAGDFRYKITSSNGKTTTTRTHRFSYRILHLPFSGLPDLLIRSEGVFDKMAGAFGFDDIDFESAEFSRRFYVKSPDRRFAYDVVSPRMMEFLLRRPGPAIDLERDRCCLSEGRRRWEPDQLKSHLRFASTFFERWPDHVVAEFSSTR